MEQQPGQGIKALVPETKEPKMPGPVFESKPGWGGRFSGWLKKSWLNKLILIAVVAAAVAAVILITRPEEVAQVSAPGERAEQTIGGIGEPQEETPAVTVQRTGEVFKIKAEAGDGITHLARKVLKQYSNENPSFAGELSVEHKIYIEDFLKDKHGERHLEINEELEFSVNDIADGIEQARQLSESQLANLSQFVPVVSGL